MHANILTKIYFIPIVFYGFLCKAIHEEESSGSREVRMINENTYLHFLGSAIKNFLEKHNVNNYHKYWIKTSEEKSSDSTIELNDIIFLFSRIFIKDAYERAMAYSDGINIQFSTWDNVENLYTYINDNFKHGFVSTSNKMTYDWLQNSQRFPYSFNHRITINFNEKFIFASQVLPKEDHINIIWNLYQRIKKLKKFKEGNVLVSLMDTDQTNLYVLKGLKILQTTNIFIKTVKGRISPIETTIKLSGNLNKKHACKLKMCFYQFEFKESPSKFTIYLNTPAMFLCLELLNSGKHLEILAYNLFMKIEYRFIFKFENSKLIKATLNGQKIEISRQILMNLLSWILTLKYDPYFIFD